MSKLLYVVARNSNNENSIPAKLKMICDRLNPDHIEFYPSKVYSGKGISYGISNPLSIITTNGSSLLFGQAFEELNTWDQVDGQIPDGNFALFRQNKKKVEIISDILGTRSVWYFKNEEFFVASTSQRAIIQFIGNFELNHTLIPWMVCNGLLGPSNSWDHRLSLLPPDSNLTLDRITWEYTVNRKEVEFQKNHKKDKENVQLMSQTIQTVVSNILLDYSKWRLTLSGGFDSRGILFSLPKIDPEGNPLKTLTWGLSGASERRKNDANVAKKLASQFDLDHTYYTTDNSSDESLEVVLDRFIKNGEGRIDHLGGYMDGFMIWKKLFEDQVEGVIRGDEAFGSYNFISDFHLKKFYGLTLPHDYENLHTNLFSSSKAYFPREYQRRKDESFETWRDRLYQSYLVPVFLAALGDLKQPYVEQINPLLSRKIIELTRHLPDHLRTDKGIFKKYVNSYKDKLPYASEPAIKGLKDIFREPEMVKLIKKELSSPLAEKIFQDILIEKVRLNIDQRSGNKSSKKNWIKEIKNLVPKSIKRQFLRTKTNNRIDFNQVAFRMFLSLKMVKLLNQDAKAV